MKQIDIGDIAIWKTGTIGIVTWVNGEKFKFQETRYNLNRNVVACYTSEKAFERFRKGWTQDSKTGFWFVPASKKCFVTGDSIDRKTEKSIH